MLSTSDFNVKIDGYIDLSAMFSNIDLAPANTLEKKRYWTISVQLHRVKKTQEKCGFLREITRRERQKVRVQGVGGSNSSREGKM